MSRGRFIIIGCTIVIAVSLLGARAHPFGDAGLYSQPHSGPILQHADVTPDARETLMTKCADCHSARTRAPLYGRFAPFSWLMEHDILEAREAMNLSRWESYSAEEQQAFKTKILLETKSHHMPLPRYLVIHRSARITESDITVFTQWARQSQSSVFSPVASVAAEGDAARGKGIFERRCTGCHSLDDNHEGPRLRGVFGRVSGSVSNFGYSTAIKQAHITWNQTTLEQWLTDPDALVPNNNMEFHVAEPQERKDLIQFLEKSN